MPIFERVKSAVEPVVSRFSGSRREAELQRQLGQTQRRLKKKDRRLAELEAALTRTQRAGTTASSADMVPVFFLVGRAKSGTTWLRRLLNSHPEILCLGEGRFFGRNWRQDYAEQVSARFPPTPLQNAILTAGDLRSWIQSSVWTRDEDVDEHLRTLTRLAINHFMGHRLSQSGKRIVGDKTPLIQPEIVREISAIYPGAKVIHIIRDGRDVAVSYMHHLWRRTRDQGGMHELEPAELEKREGYRRDPAKFLATGEGIFTEQRLATLAREWSTQVGGTIEYGATLMEDDYAEVRYEGLLERPEEEVERLLAFLAVDASDEVVRRCVSSASFEKRTKGRQRGEEDFDSFVRKGIAGDWKNVFTERDKSIFKKYAGESLIEVGYEKDANW